MSGTLTKTVFVVLAPIGTDAAATMTGGTGDNRQSSGLQSLEWLNRAGGCERVEATDLKKVFEWYRLYQQLGHTDDIW